MPIGRSIPQSIVNAINLREDKFSSDNKAPEDLKFTHGRSSFVVMRSLVKVKDSFDLSKKAVLTGGIGNVGRSGIDREAGKDFSTSEAAYYQNEVYGFRPMPGITNVNSSVLGSSGAARKTVVSFIANSPQDLDLLNKVYMHFGATVLVEFGHTVYLNKSGDVKEMTIGDLISSEEFFQNGITLNSIKQKIDRKTKDKNYSYEGIVGYVSNFEFSINEEGAFNCSLTIMSHNAVTDSLSIPNVIDNLDKFKPAESAEEAEADVPKGLTNLVDLICSRMSNYNAKTGKVNLREVFDDPNVKLDGIGDWVSNYHAYISTVPVQGAVTEEEAAAGQENSEGMFIAFLPLRFWLALFNVYAMPRVKGKNGQLVRWSMSSNNWRGYKFMYSHNPGMVQLSRKATGVTEAFNVTAGNPFTGLRNYRGEDLVDVNEPGNRQILDIRVSNQLISKVNSNFVAQNPKREDEIGMTDWVGLLIDEIQKYMGNVNSFEIANNPREVDNVLQDELEIYDKSGRQGKGALLNLTGLSSTVTGINIKSNISNRIQTAAMLSGGGSKSNSGGKTGAGLENTNAKSEGVDALTGNSFTIQTKVSSDDSDDGSEENPKGKKDIADIITDVYAQWNAGQGNKFEDILDSSQQYMKSLIGSKSIGKYMPIPVDIDIEMLGVGGFRNLECFTIPDHLLPKRFGNSNFIIMSVEHSLDVSDSMWRTAITGMLKPN